MVSTSHGRAAAWTAAAMLAAGAGFQFYWGLGWMLGLHEASAGAEPPSTSDQIDTVMFGLLALAFAGVLLVRVGYWREHAPLAVVRFARIHAWVLVVVPLGGALQSFAGPTDFDRFVAGPINLIVALLALVVVRSDQPLSPRNGTPTPSGERKPGPPSSVH